MLGLPDLRHQWRNVRKVKRDLVHRVVGIPWMDVRDSDCFLFSYPRSGNTWLRHITYFALEGRHVADHETMEARLPTIDTLEFRDRLTCLPPGPRCFKSHLPFAPYFLNGKVVYVVRDGRDATISYYDYFRHIHDYRGSFDAFLDKAMHGWMRYGSWRDNVGGWVTHRDHPNMLLIRYEDLRADPMATAEQVFAFCGLDVPTDRLAEAVSQSSVEKVHATFQTWNNARGTNFTGGASGGGKKGWRNVLTEEQNRRFVDHAGPLLQQLGYDLA